MYICRICQYQILDREFGELEESWVCPQCGVGKAEFEHSTDSASREQPFMLMFRAITESLWKVLGNGSQAVTREMGFILAESINPEDPVRSTAEYFLRHGFSAAIECNEEGDKHVMNVKNCRFYGFCRSLEDNGVTLSTCPYANTAAAALEISTGYRYRIRKLPGKYGHMIELSEISKK